ncbi:MAG: T9SS type A sorting domain-containing protein [candidate division Zixibacteria bacterium]|nr:T9SS type A sorting domain-containing protein [candidate division Zixibacteria bacterium]
MSCPRPFLAAVLAVSLAWIPAVAGTAQDPSRPDIRPSPPGARYRALHVDLRPAYPIPATPTAAVEALAAAYEAKSVPALDELLAGDFQFHTTDVHIARLIDVDRAKEMQIARALFRGAIHRGEVTSPPADSISFVFEGLTESPDPEHPDSTTHFRTVTAARFRGDIYVPDGKVFHAGGQGAQVFYVVRGDAAVLVSSSPADSTRWYIRRWFEDLDALVASLSEIEGDCDQADSLGAQAASALALGIHPLGNPACPALDIACDLPRSGPARVEVFDIMGRRMSQKVLDVATPGTIRLQAGAGTHLAPGAYWVRLTQGNLSKNRMVVVAR